MRKLPGAAVTDAVPRNLRGPGAVLLVSCYELGHQPLGIAWPRAFLERAGYAPDYLDLAVEFTGYLYVVSADPNNNHRLDIYHPSQKGTQPICTTLHVNAAKLAVDFWRSVYTLNYEVLQLPSGVIPEFTAPSVSLWVPPPPAAISARGT